MHAVPLHAEPRRLSRAEYDRMAELGFFRAERVELIRGTVVRMAPIGPNHSDPVDVLNVLFVRAIGERARVRIQSPFLAADDSEPEPDVALVPYRRYADEHPRDAFLIVEVADSSLLYDRNTKAPLYAESGVDEYWIVDVAARAVEVHDQPRDGVYSRVQRYGTEADVRPAAFPDIVLRVGDLFV